MKIVCIKTCYTQGRVWKPGQTAEAEKPYNKHFVQAGRQAVAEVKVDLLKAEHAKSVKDAANDGTSAKIPTKDSGAPAKKPDAKPGFLD